MCAGDQVNLQFHEDKLSFEACTGNMSDSSVQIPGDGTCDAGGGKNGLLLVLS